MISTTKEESLPDEVANIEIIKVQNESRALAFKPVEWKSWSLSSHTTYCYLCWNELLDADTSVFSHYLKSYCM